MIRLLFLFLFASLPASLAAQFDEPMRQHDAHVHGEASGHLALDDSVLRIELEIPAYNLIGFEHAPVNADQQALLDNTVEALEKLDWLSLDRRGQCEQSAVNVHTHGMEAEHHHDGDATVDHADHNDHDHDHDHNHDNHDHDHRPTDDHDHKHGSFHAVVELSCSQAQSLGWLAIDLFTDYPANQTMRLDVLTESLVKQVDLRPGRFRVDLTP